MPLSVSDCQSNFPVMKNRHHLLYQKQTGIDKSKITQTAAQAANNTNPLKVIIESEYDFDSEKKVTKVGEVKRFFILGLIQKDYFIISI
ncbi:TPA: hypothetical protein F7006_06440 [Legionella pneumophila]|nr:hypothetical protein [Legionella pneumophila]